MPAATPTDYNSAPIRLIRFLGSMPVAVFLLGLIAVTSMIGTVLVQNQSRDVYVSRLGPTWYEWLERFDLFDMYDSWWFITILTLLVLSVSSALLRHGPRFWSMARPLHTMRPWPKRSDASLTIQTPLVNQPEEVEARLRQLGFTEFSRNDDENFPLLLARQGRFSKYGFFLVHGGVVLICIGGLITSQFGFRGTMNIAEHESEQQIYVQEGQRTRVLQLPFEVRNDNFDIKFYQSGMPSEYSSQLSLVQEGDVLAEKRITVNDPLHYKGVTFYQSSFGDAGSKVNFTIHDLTLKGFPEHQVEARVHESLEDQMGVKLTIKELRQHNVMNMAEQPGQTELQDVGPSLDLHLSSPSSGNITYRVYLAFPHMLVFARAGETELTYATLGFPLSDSTRMGLLSAYLDELSKLESRGPDENRAAFAAAIQRQGLPISEAINLGPEIAMAERVLNQYKLPMLFSFRSYEPKMYTGLQVARDPGSPLVWSACAILVIGLYMMIYMHEKRVWLRFNREQQQLEVCALLSGKDKHPLHRTMARVQQALVVTKASKEVNT